MVVRKDGREEKGTFKQKTGKYQFYLDGEGQIVSGEFLATGIWKEGVLILGSAKGNILDHVCDI